MVRKQKTDARDAAHLLELLLSERFPRLWRPTTAERDLRQLVWHRQKLVWMRTAIGNQLLGVPHPFALFAKGWVFRILQIARLAGLATATDLVVHQGCFDMANPDSTPPIN